MKKTFGILLIIVGIVCLPRCFSPIPSEMVGMLIGNALITFLPAFFLLRNSEKDEQENKEESKQE